MSMIKVEFAECGDGPTKTQGTRVVLIDDEGEHPIDVLGLVLMAKPMDVWQAVITVPVKVGSEVNANLLATQEE